MLPFHALDAGTVVQQLGSSRQGLSREEAQRRLRQYGPNELPRERRLVVLRAVGRQFCNAFVILLLAATGLSMLLGDVLEALVILVITGLIICVGAVYEYRSERLLAALQQMVTPQARVIRDGVLRLVPARELVPGDIIVVEAGDRVPADARLLEAVDLYVNEAALTGEAFPVEKSVDPLPADTPVADRCNMLFQATDVVRGRGVAVVTATGVRTVFGRIAEAVREMKEEPPPLKKQLDRFVRVLGVVIAVICGVFFAVLAVVSRSLAGIVEALVFAVALAVAAVPEGLPATVTLTLALGARELARHRAIIRRLASVEALGAVTTICSDKTGTLTKGELTVRCILTASHSVNVTGVGYDPSGEFFEEDQRIDPLRDPELLAVLEASVLCNNAEFNPPQVVGDPLEVALLVVAAKARMDYRRVRAQQPRIQEVPFTPERKYMITIHRRGERCVAYVKGAPEVILERCTRILRGSSVEQLSKDERQRFLDYASSMAKQALRVLGLAFRELSSCEEIEDANHNLVLIGLVGFFDPPREEAKLAIKRCKEAGIRSVMVTGDHALTAAAIARELGMLERGRVLVGRDLDQMSDEELESVVEEVEVFARITPAHKLRIVQALQRRGQLVAVTGDGVNDAPALKRADVGVAMGVTGTDVAKEAADVVLADDNFATLVRAVEGGRIIYDRIRKFVRFLLTTNLAEVLILALALVLFGPQLLPLTPATILWVNLVTDGPPAVALGIDPPTEDLMKQPPRDPRETILHRLTRFIAVAAIVQTVMVLTVFFVDLYTLQRGVEHARTTAFLTLVLLELLMVWNCRSERQHAFTIGPVKNPMLVLAVAFSLGVTVAVCYTPYVALAMGIAVPNLTTWLLSIFASLPILALHPGKLIPQRG